MGNKQRQGEEDWGHSEFQARRNKRAQAKIEKRCRKASRKRKKMENTDEF